MEVRPLKVAVWGLGTHALKNVLPAIKHSPYFKLSGVYTRKQATILSVSRQYDCLSWENERLMLADPRVDGIYLCTPIGLHHEQGMEILRSGKHLICEKSLTHNRETAFELISVARMNNLILCETFMYLYHPQFSRLLDFVCNAAFGKVHSLTCTFLLPKLENPGFRNNANLGGGAFLDAGCYAVSLLLALRCCPDPSVQYSYIRFDKTFGADTSGAAIFRCSSGAHGYLAWGYGFGYRNHLSVSGERQSIEVPLVFSKRPEQRTHITLRDQSGSETQIEVQPANSFVEMFSHIYRAADDLVVRENLLLQAERQAILMDQIKVCALTA